MTAKRKLEVFSAACPVCEETIQLINRIACPSCDVTVVPMNEPAAASRAKRLGVRSVPAVAIDGKLLPCCSERGPEEKTLRAFGVGEPL